MYKHLPKLTIFIWILSLSGCISYGETEAEMALAKPEIAPRDAIQQAGELYKQRADLNKTRKAISILEKARDMNNRNYEVEWKFAKYSYFLGSRQNVESEEAEEVLKKGLSAARIAKRMESDKPEGHFWYGAILGEQSKRSPVTIGLASVKKIREAMQKVIEIDPDYQGSSAYDALGQLELGTRNLGGGSAEKAVEYLEKALELSKDNSYIRLHLGEAYLAVNKDDEAKAQLQFLIKMKPHPDFLPEHEESLEKAKKLFDQKF